MTKLFLTQKSPLDKSQDTKVPQIKIIPRTKKFKNIFISDDVTLVICPGICNSSESVYIRRTTYQAQLTGFRVAVLNHIGALKKLQITSPRIFNYGNTGDYHLMVVDILKRFPNTKIVCVGFSMGANLVTKYLGETERSEQIMAGISVCQGYDAKE